MSELTQERLKELLDYDAETGAFSRTASRGGSRSGSRAGCLRRGGYRLIMIDRRLYYEHRLAWLYVHGKWPPDDIDHTNGVRDDNRICNLREATRGQNMRNSRLYSNNKSGVTGVGWDESRGKWAAQIRLNGKNIHLGRFRQKKVAIVARRYAERRFHGEFAAYRGARAGGAGVTSDT